MVRLMQTLAVPFNQDDQRERAMVSALNLQQDPDRSRQAADAYLDVDISDSSTRIEFECKSAPESRDFGTGRDTGLRQLRRWAGMHFVFGWFEPRDNQPVRMWYGSPRMMRAWNLAEQAYLTADLVLVDHVPASVDATVFARLLGGKDEFSYEDMKGIVKNQWTADTRAGRGNLYKARADIVSTGKTTDFRYSRAVAEQAVRDRVAYLLDRGSTVNNRKIPAKYVIENCVEIQPPRWAVTLANEVDRALSLEPPSG